MSLLLEDMTLNKSAADWSWCILSVHIEQATIEAIPIWLSTDIPSRLLTKPSQGQIIVFCRQNYKGSLWVITCEHEAEYGRGEVMVEVQNTWHEPERRVVKEPTQEQEVWRIYHSLSTSWKKSRCLINVETT